MSEVSFEIGPYSSDTRTVAVTFTSGTLTHQRPVNAVLKETGEYDKAATRTRVEDVARGVAVKIQSGAITDADAVPESIDAPKV